LKVGTALGGALGVLGSLPEVACASPEAKPDAVSVALNHLPRRPDEDVLLHMQRSLLKALQKPVEKRRWVMVIDTRKCIGCHACTVACVMENKLPPGVVYRPVIDMETGKYPNTGRKFLPRPCMQCEKPPCVPVCPVGATWKRPDGIIAIDYNACIGCRYCIAACPYQARTFDFGKHWTDNAASGKDDALALNTGIQYQFEASQEYGTPWKRKNNGKKQSPVGNARKCTFCVHRLNQGQLPMCVTTCIARATYFGDAEDSDALVSKMASQNNAILLKPESGVGPRVTYLV